MARNITNIVDNCYVQKDAEWDEFDYAVRLYCLRLLVNGGGHREFLGDKDYKDFEIADVCGITRPYNWRTEDSRYTREQGMKFLRATLKDAEKNSVRFPKVLSDNTDEIGDLIGLSKLERRVLMFMVMVNRSEVLERVVSMSFRQTRNRSWVTIGAALGYDPDRVNDVIQPGGILSQSGLLRFDMEYGIVRDLMYSILSHLPSLLLSENMVMDDLFSKYCHGKNPPKITLDDISHIELDYKGIKEILSKSIETKQKGINILLYGPPGTGKTEFARLLCDNMGWDLREISHTSPTGESMDSRRRLKTWSFCQHVFKRSDDVVLMFDEMEEGFEKPLFRSFRDGNESISKAWINERLEQNPVPCIWIANNLELVDPSHLRRFTVIKEINPLPVETRRKMVNEMFANVSVSDRWVNKVSSHRYITPSQITQISRLHNLVSPGLNNDETETFLTEQIETQLKFQGASPLPVVRSEGLPWRLDLIETDTPVGGLVNGLKSSKKGSVLLYGPPGTGKTAFVHGLSRELVIPVLSKTGSDLLDKYVGGTERNIADMFREASGAGEILFLDEADSVLRSREHARNSWEVSQVNEFLARMEVFDGVFICATNNINSLDPASIRRFDMKVALEYPNDNRRWELFMHLLSTIGIVKPTGRMSSDCRQKLNDLSTLTPGDFGTVARRYYRFGGMRTVDDVLNELESEVRLKNRGAKSRIGFI